jgi:hypothetical protein
MFNGAELTAKVIQVKSDQGVNMNLSTLRTPVWRKCGLMLEIVTLLLAWLILRLFPI